LFYIFHGDDEFTRAEELTRLRGTLAGGDPAMAELNTTVLDGNQVTLGELRHVCDAIPFMADRRLAIVHGLLSRLSPASRAKGQKRPSDQEPAWKARFLEDLADYLPNLPPTTRLILVEHRKLPRSNSIIKLATSPDMVDKGFVKLFKQPRDWDLPNWIQERARTKGGQISREAADLLVMLVGNDLRLQDQEIEKLLIYADGRQVTARDVQALVSRARETSIFDLVDCVGRRQTDKALILLHRLLDDGQAPLYLLAMLARQIRILLQIKDLQAQNVLQKEIARRLSLHPYVVEKGHAQTQNFTIAQLELAHQRLVEADWLIKTGQAEGVLALDLLVTDLTTA
jgi:DNA polymerase-3 subunit delta